MEKFIELDFGDINSYKILAGELGENLRSISRMLGVSISSRGTKVFIKGDAQSVSIAEKAVRDLYREIRDGLALSRSDVEERVAEIRKGEAKSGGDEDRNLNVILTTYRGKKISPKTQNQLEYIKSIESNDVVFVIGPAGSGKTYIAVSMAIKYLKSGQVSKIILTRPAIEAGEKIGYLPGGILEKVDPFMRPVYDCLYDILDYREMIKLMEKGMIEIIPIAFMRGRTLNDSFIIVDEAQNLTYEQVKMVLTRIGIGSKMVLTADITQIDIQKPGICGLNEVLKEVAGVDFVYLTNEDIVRHPVVSRIIRALEEFEKRNK